MRRKAAVAHDAELHAFVGTDDAAPAPKQPQKPLSSRRGCVPGLGWLSEYWDPQRLVDPPERSVMIEQPTLRLFPRMIWLPAILMLVGVMSFSGASSTDPAPARSGVTLIAIAAAWMLVKYLSWALTYYVVTTQRVLVVTGVVRRRFTNVQLDKIAQVEFTQSLLERTLDWGVVSIRAPGQRPPEMDIRDLRNASLFYRELMYEISYGARRGTVMSQPRPMQTLPPPKRRRRGELAWTPQTQTQGQTPHADDTAEMQAVPPPPAPQPAPQSPPAQSDSSWPSKRWSQD